MNWHPIELKLKQPNQPLPRLLSAKDLAISEDLRKLINQTLASILLFFHPTTQSQAIESGQASIMDLYKRYLQNFYIAIDFFYMHKIYVDPGYFDVLFTVIDRLCESADIENKIDYKKMAAMIFQTAADKLILPLQNFKLEDSKFYKEIYAAFADKFLNEVSELDKGKEYTFAKLYDDATKEVSKYYPFLEPSFSNRTAACRAEHPKIYYASHYSPSLIGNGFQTHVHDILTSTQKKDKQTVRHRHPTETSPLIPR